LKGPETRTTPASPQRRALVTARPSAAGHRQQTCPQAADGRWQAPGRAGYRPPPSIVTAGARRPRPRGERPRGRRGANRARDRRAHFGDTPVLGGASRGCGAPGRERNGSEGERPDDIRTTEHPEGSGNAPKGTRRCPAHRIRLAWTTGSSSTMSPLEALTTTPTSSGGGARTHDLRINSPRPIVQWAIYRALVCEISCRTVHSVAAYQPMAASPRSDQTTPQVDGQYTLEQVDSPHYHQHASDGRR
jgi:hypothetical protein